MVGPISSEERSAFALKLKVGLTLVVGLSAALMAVSGGASPAFVALAAAAGVAVGAPLVWFVFPGTGEVTSDRNDRRR